MAALLLGRRAAMPASPTGTERLKRIESNL
jgi:hypothetical protein